MDSQTRKIVLGLGNLLQRDEGLGVRAMEALRERLGEVPGLEFIDGGTLGLDLLPIVEDCSHLLLLDAVDARQAPGALVELSKDEIPLYSGVKLSQHQVGFQEVLGLAALRGHLPAYVHLIGIQPAELSLGMDLSEPVTQRIPGVVARASEVLRGWGLV